MIKDKIKNLITAKKFWIGLIIIAQALALIYFFGGQWLNNERVRYANMGAQTVRNAIYLEAFQKGSVRIDAVVEVEGGEERETEIRSIMLTPIINQVKE